MSAAFDPAGRLQLAPGGAGPTIVSTRPELAARVAEGRDAAALPMLMGALYTLCAMPHRLASAAAVAAAAGRPDTLSSAADRQALRASQAREQILRIAHDWPRLWPGLWPGLWSASSAGPKPLGALLHGCPLWHAALAPQQQMAALPHWIERCWLGCRPDVWLAAQRRHPQSFAVHWCEGVDSPVARTLLAMRDDAQRLATPAQALAVLANVEREMPLLARRMLDEPGYCARPDWNGHCADTGPWSRSHDAVAVPAVNAWQRLVSRLVDVLQLAAPGGERWLAAGALNLGGGLGVAWAEMARGLLVHAVALDAGRGRVAACRVLAPTEWNFHPLGGLAQALAALRGETSSADAHRLAVAYDPCVEFEVAQPEHECEASHA